MKRTILCIAALFLMIGAIGCDQEKPWRRVVFYIKDVDTGELQGPYRDHNAAESWIINWKRECNEFNETAQKEALAARGDKEPKSVRLPGGVVMVEPTFVCAYRFDRNFKIIEWDTTQGDPRYKP